MKSEKLNDYKLDGGIMCLAVPSRIVKIGKNEVAEVEIGGVRRKVSLSLLSEVKVGDYVLVHAGFAIETVKEEEAKETLKLLEEIGEVYQ